MKVGELITKDSSKIGMIARQLASAAMSEFNNPKKAKDAAERGANRIYSALIKGIDEHFKDAQMKTVNEAVDGDKLKKLSMAIFKMAEDAAFEESAEGKRAVGGDQVWKKAETLITTIKDAVSDYIHQEYKK